MATEDVDTLAPAMLRALDALPVGVSVLRFAPTGVRRIYVNDALAAMVGTTLDELREAPPYAILPPEARTRIAPIEGAWLAGGTIPEILESELLTRDGRAVPIEARMVTGTIGGDPMLTMFVSDISSRVRAADALRSSEALFRELAEAGPDSITIILDGRVAYANPAAARMLGYPSADALVGVALVDFVAPEELAMMGDRIRRVFSGERMAPIEYRGRRADGDYITVEISAIAITFRGRPAVLSVGRDVGERKRRQAEQVRADRMAAVGTLAAGVAHEINNPLTYVILQVERLRGFLERHVADADARAHGLAMIGDALDGSERVARIVRDLLWFARDEGSGTGPTSIADAVDTSIKLATSALRHRAQVVRTITEVPPVAASAARLTQVFLNLLVNAVQAFAADAPDVNRIEARVRPSPDERRVVVEIIDNGPGIPDELRPRIFEPFFTTKAGGTGLGLAISRSIVEEAGGTISAHAAEDGGTIMRVELPAWHGEHVPMRRVVPAAPPTPSRVLIVDDEPLLVRAVANCLAGQHQVAVASTAYEAFDRIAAGPRFDVVICDVMMPGTSGVALARRAVAHDAGYRGRFVFISGGAITVELQAALTELDAGFVAKPFEVAELEDAIARAVERSVNA